MSKYADIIARLEKAEVPDRELDAEITFATGAFDYKLKYGLEHSRIERGERRTDDLIEVVVAAKGKLIYDEPYERYTASIDAAIALVERMLPGKPMLLGTGQTELTTPWARIGSWNGFDAVGVTLPVAILLALFRALDAQEDRT